MKRGIFILALLFFVFFSIGQVSAAHFIIGRANNAIDGTSANGRTIVLWNPAHGTSDNLTDTIGQTGNSGVNNTYMIDCELLSNGCNIGDTLNLRILNSGDNYNSGNVSVTVTGAGFDIVPNVTLNAPPNVTSVNVDDSIKTPANQIDLTAATNKTIYCTALVEDPEGGPLNLSAEFFDSGSSYGGADDNNNHYTNSSCVTNSSYVPVGNESQAVCGFDVWYYANTGTWTCLLKATDNLSMSSNGTDTTTINPLLSVGLVSTVDYGLLNTFNISNEVEVNVTNYGNVNINLSLYGYAQAEGDGYAMNCSLGQGIPLQYERYNLTNSNPGSLDYASFTSNYQNLSGNYSVENFKINQRQNDLVNDAVNSTYWRILVPPGNGGNCTGNIVFGASTAPAS